MERPLSGNLPASVAQAKSDKAQSGSQNFCLQVICILLTYISLAESSSLTQLTSRNRGSIYLFQGGQQILVKSKQISHMAVIFRAGVSKHHTVTSFCKQTFIGIGTDLYPLIYIWWQLLCITRQRRIIMTETVWLEKTKILLSSFQTLFFYPDLEKQKDACINI